METSKRRVYTKKIRSAVLTAVRKKGVCAAAKEHGVPQSCVSRWAKTADVRRDGPAPRRQEAPRSPRDDAPAKAPRAEATKARRAEQPHVAKIYVTPPRSAS